MFAWFDPLYLLLVGPGILLALYAQARTMAAYRKWSQVRATTGMTGAQVARKLLDFDRLQDVAIERVAGELTDHYDPRARVLRLSQGVHDSNSIAAIGIAAHELGHALQHAHAYAPLRARQAFYPVAAFSSKAWVWLLMAAFFLPSIEGQQALMYAAIGCLSAYALFALVTLPVEFDASRRALVVLESSRTLKVEELGGARKVLSAAALTYVASAAQAVMMVIWLVIRSQRR